MSTNKCVLVCHLLCLDIDVEEWVKEWLNKGAVLSVFLPRQFLCVSFRISNQRAMLLAQVLKL